ncbi:MAG: 2-iminoacetate synthase ThiH [Candidatus Azobacteroides pseudotrichonymphae]|jgi:2-iminoacetate synthase|nr:MAG: 2-iminoacetate synthase ThiH [Candidatus Azobacteroides pseudotrichonymphae]
MRPMSFYDIKKNYNKLDFTKYTKKLSEKAIKDSLDKEFLNETDFLNLLSPQAFTYIEDMAQKAHAIANKQFGKTILLYAPLYVSNFCINDCIYCGFSSKNKIKRNVLTLEEVEQECKVLTDYGIRHILLVTGESRIKSSVQYLKECTAILSDYFDYIDIEVYPLEIDEYLQLKQFGVHGLTIYQETYNESLYKILHTNGTKSNYKYRLETCERAGNAGYINLTVGALLGLNDFISEVFFAGLHAKYLQKTFPFAEIGISFPRLRPAAGNYQPKTIISDRDLVQAICAIRLFMNRINISISTRESNELRNNLISLGVTKISAGSSTEIGGYSNKNRTEGQFIINDHSNVEQIKNMIHKKGYQPILKDWML